MIIASINYMKRTVSIISALLVAVNCLSQVPDWNWARRIGGTDTDGGQSTTVDAFGNLYVAGYFYSPSISFDSIILTNTNGSGNISDIFIVKYNEQGVAQWAKSAGGMQGMDKVRSIKTDSAGAIYMTGSFISPSISFDSFVLNNMDTLNAPGVTSDMYIVKYDTSGNALWAKSYGGLGGEGGTSIALDTAENIYISGGFDYNFSIGSTTLNYSGGQDLFIAKFDRNGNALWAKSAGGFMNDIATCVATDIFGSVYLTGYFQSPSVTFDTITFSNTGGLDIFLLKYDMEGNLQWAKSHTGNSADQANFLATDIQGNVYEAGSYRSSSIAFDNLILNGTGNDKIYLAKYDSSGNITWARSFGNINGDNASSVATDKFGNAYLTGFFYDTLIYFDSFSFSSPTPSRLFLAKFGGNGNVLWAKSTTGNSGASSYANSIAANDYGDIYVTGFYAGSSLILDSVTLSSALSSDAFIARIDASTSVGNSKIEKSENEIIIYPNPFHLQTTISFFEEQKHVKIKILDILGNCIKTINFNGTQLTIEKGEMKAGIYFVEIRDEKNTISNRKIVIQ